MEKRHFTENQKKLIGGVAIVIFVVFSAAICWFVGKPMVKFVSEPEKFRMWVDSHGLWSQVAYVGMWKSAAVRSSKTYTPAWKMREWRKIPVTAS